MGGGGSHQSPVASGDMASGAAGERPRVEIRKSRVESNGHDNGRGVEESKRPYGRDSKVESREERPNGPSPPGPLSKQRGEGGGNGHGQRPRRRGVETAYGRESGVEGREERPNGPGRRSCLCMAQIHGHGPRLCSHTLSTFLCLTRHGGVVRITQLSPGRRTGEAGWARWLGRAAPEIVGTPWRGDQSWWRMRSVGKPS